MFNRKPIVAFCLLLVFFLLGCGTDAPRLSEQDYLNEDSPAEPELVNPDRVATSRWERIWFRSFRSADQDGDGRLTQAEFTWSPRFPEQTKETFESVDLDHDGELILSECMDIVSLMEFQRTDRDSNGIVSTDEYRWYWQGDHSVSTLDRLYAALDQDGNQQVTFSEYCDQSSIIAHIRADVDANGTLTLAEYRTATKNEYGEAHAEAVFKARDEDRNGVLDPLEYSSNTPAVAHATEDTDLDGRLSLDEYTAWATNEMAREVETDLFHHLDCDGDAHLTVEENAVRLDGRWIPFIRSDEDGDARLSLTEFCAFSSKQLPQAVARRVFAQVDRNGDGFLSFDEHRNRPQQIGYIQWDWNGDDQLSAEEFCRSLANRFTNRHASAVFSARDGNHDGSLTPGEYFARGFDIDFAVRDVDQDGRLSREEELDSVIDPENRPSRIELFDQLDRDSDGQLTLDEHLLRADRAKLAFLVADTDGSGSWSHTEFRAYSQHQIPAETMDRVFTVLDRDDDGMVSLDEHQNRPIETSHVRADIDGDGRVSEDEFQHFVADGLSSDLAAAVWAVRDADDDGWLSPEELAARGAEIDFVRRDADGDGRLSRNEFLSGRTAPLVNKRYGVVFDQLDANADLCLDRQEHTAVFHFRWGQFTNADVDGSGTWSFDEYCRSLPDDVPRSAARRVFEIIDRDHNEQVTYMEHRYRPTGWAHAQTDWDGDGGVSLDEFVRSSASRLTQQHAERIFRVRDVDGDLNLSIEELSANDAEIRFAVKDADMNGLLSNEENLTLAPNPTAQREEEVLFKLLDGNTDSLLSFGEYAIQFENAWKPFSRDDKDGNGQWSLEEFLAGQGSDVSNDVAVRLFSRLDADQSGDVSYIEHRDRPPELPHIRADLDGNGTLSLDEYQQSQTGRVEQSCVASLFAVLDTNGDGGLAPDEFSRSGPDVRFARRDVNVDHHLTLKENVSGLTDALEREKETSLFSRLDRDGDGSLTMEEHSLRADPKRLGFLTRDTDGDGVWSLDEFREQALEGLPEEITQRLFRLVDQDHDDRVSYEENTNRPAESGLVRADWNSDGLVSVEEFQRDRATTLESVQAAAVFRAKDTDNDSMLTQDEFSRVGPSIEFALRDANADGSLSLKEHLAAVPPDEKRQVSDIFHHLDTDKDGSLTLDEFSPPQDTE